MDQPMKFLNQRVGHSGKLIAIGGIDGCGKSVQTERLLKRLQAEGHVTAEYDFPRYGDVPNGQPASHFVRKYLQKPEYGFTNGYGPAGNVNPWAVSLMYALDRFDAAYCHEDRPNLWDVLRAGSVVVSNRYAESNIAYQASKFEDRSERLEFIKWLHQLEYEQLGIPKPDLMILLDLVPEVATVLKGTQRQAQGIALDAHEKDLDILNRAYQAYREAAELFPETWKVVQVADVSRVSEGIKAMYSIDDIHEKVWQYVQEILPKK